MGSNIKKTIFDWIRKAVLRLVLLLVAVSFLQVAALTFFNPPGTVNMVYEWAIATWKDMAFKSRAYKWTDIEDISPYLQKAVLASEDQRFFHHHGFDFTEIKHALGDIITGKGLRGASTISMQAARSLFLPSSRSVIRKIAEAWYTVIIELVWSKKRILEIYLNTVDWGKANVGAQAAAQAYFSCNARDLTADQAALLAAILPSPHKWSAVNPTPYIIQRKERILKQMPPMPAF